MILFERLVLLTCAAVLVLAPAAYGAADKSKETPGIAAYQATKGAFKRDRKISQHIVRSEHKKRSSEAIHTRWSCNAFRKRKMLRRCAAVSPGR